MSPSSPPSPPIPLDYGRADAPRRSNGQAVASLVLGLLGCVPLLTGLLAILFGIMGLRKARDPAVPGKGLAVAGLVLGIISVLGWMGFGGMLGYGYVESKPAGIVAKQFLQDVSAGNDDTAAANSYFSAAHLQTQTSQMAAFGTLQSVSISSFNVSILNAQTTMHLEGTATFSNGPKACKFDLVKAGRKYLVTSFWVQ